MAVINCPSCGKKISDKAKSCSHCAVNLQELDTEKLQSIKVEKRIKESASIMNQSFIAMLLFCGGFLFMFWQNTQPGSFQYIAAMTSTIVGFFWYIINRVRLILIKRSSK